MFGAVAIGEGSSLWPGVVIRAEMLSVKVGRFVNLQDHVMVHIGYGTPTTIGDHASITHRVVLHGCTIGENCLIGIGATIMDGAVIGANSIVAGHTFVREGQIIPPNSIVVGTPAKVVRTADNFVANRLDAWLIIATRWPMRGAIIGPGSGPSSRRPKRLSGPGSRHFTRRAPHTGLSAIDPHWRQILCQ